MAKPLKFNPDNITKEQVKYFAESIEEYLEASKEIMIIPEELYDELGEDMMFVLRELSKMAKRMKKGDMRYFKKYEDWKSLH